MARKRTIVMNELMTTDLSSFSFIRSVADGCPGQNNNINIIAMCTNWLKVNASPSIKKLELIYPVTGHFFLPSGRVFGLIEKQLTKTETKKRGLL